VLMECVCECSAHIVRVTKALVQEVQES